MPDERASARFEESVLPHLDAAYNLARWLTKSDQDAEDLVQESLLRALQGIGGLRGSDGRAWLLAIVRNACYSWLRGNRPHELSTPFDETLHSADGDVWNPERLAVREGESERVRLALEELPAPYREALVLREFEGLSYREIAAVAGVPIGTVMSRLSRGRERLQRALAVPSQTRERSAER